MTRTERAEQAISLREAGRTWAEVADALGYANASGPYLAVASLGRDPKAVRRPRPERATYRRKFPTLAERTTTTGIVCLRCGVAKPEAAYGRQRSWCRDCVREAVGRSRTAGRPAPLLLTVTSTGVRAVFRDKVPDPARRAFYAALVRDPCAYCGKRTADAHRDHIVPRAVVGERGQRGSYCAAAFDNLTASCAECNQAKSDTPLLVFLAERAG